MTTAEAPVPDVDHRGSPPGPSLVAAHTRVDRWRVDADRALLRLPAWHLPPTLDVRHPRSAPWTWVATRLAMLLVVGFAQENIVGDVTYYGRSLYQMFHGVPLRETLQEYPLPVLGVLLPQFLVGGLNPLAFGLLFLVSMLAVDAAFTRHLVRARRAARQAAGHDPDGAPAVGAVAFWLWFVPLIGPMAYFRFDLVPAVLAGAAITAAVTRPARAGALTAVGAALKLWPAALLPSFLLDRAGRRRAAVGFVAAGVVVLAVSALVGGVTRLVSPLQWQSERGLQIESVFALPLMIARIFHPHGVWELRVSHFKAWEVFGAGAHLLVTVSTVATVLTVGWLVWVWVRAFRLPRPSTVLVGWLVLATVAVMTVVNKTLSPQYLIWLGGPLAAMLVRPDRDRALRRVLVEMLVVAGLTQVIFPLTYNWMLGASWLMPPVTVVLMVRNVLLVHITWLAARRVWELTRREPAAADGAVAVDDVPADDVPVDDTQSVSSTA